MAPTQTDLALGFWQAAQAAFQCAAPLPLVRYFRVAGLEVCLRFANDRLLNPLTQALLPLALTEISAEPDLTIDVWDSASTGVAMPATAWRWDGDTACPVYASYQQWRGGLNLYEPERAHAMLWIADAADLLPVVSAAPFLSVFQWHFSRHQRLLVHGAGLGVSAGGILLAGKGGSGKSTTSIAALLHSSLGFAGDDYVVLENRPSGAEVHGIYASAKLLPDSRAWLPVAVSGIPVHEDKQLYLLAEAYPERFMSHFPLRAILVPQVASSTALNPLSPSRALIALAPQSLLAFSGTGDHHLHFLGTIVRHVPCYQLSLGRDLDAILRLLEAFVEEQNAHAS